MGSERHHFLQPGPSRGRGEGGGLKNGQKSEVLRMRFPIVENVCTSSGIVLVTSRGLQLPYRKKSKKIVAFLIDFSNYRIFPYFSVSTLVDGPCCDPWSLDACRCGKRQSSCNPVDHWSRMKCPKSKHTKVCHLPVILSIVLGMHASSSCLSSCPRGPGPKWAQGPSGPSA